MIPIFHRVILISCVLIFKLSFKVNILPDGSQIYVKQEENGQVELVQLQGAEMHETETAEETEGQISENADDNSGQVVAQLIEAGEPNPAGKINVFWK